MTGHCNYVAIETTLIDICGNDILISVAEVHICVSKKVHENSSNNLRVTLKYIRNLVEYCKYVAMETTMVDIHGNNTIMSEGDYNIYFP